MGTTLEDLRSQLLSELKIDPNSRINSVSLLNRNINRGLRKVQQETNYSLPDNVTSTTISTTSGTQEENLPSDFMRIASPHGVKLNDNTPLYPVDYVGLLGQENLSTDSGQPLRYYIRKTSSSQWVIGFYPGPDSSYTITVPYYKKLTEMSSNSDESPLDEDYDESIVQYAAYLTMRRIKGFESKAADFLDFYKEAIADVTANTQAANQYAIKVGYERTPSGVTPNPKSFGDNTYSVY